MSFIPLSKADVDILEKEKKEIERRRTVEAERKKYFFDEKKRGIGIDIDYIKKQIEEKQKRKNAEKETDKQYRNKIESFVDKLTILDENRNKYYKRKTVECGEHQRNSKIQNTDTWYLNDPKRISNDIPPRINDEQRITSCSLQKFDGEDLGINKRKKSQQTEIQKWCDMIIDEKNKHKQRQEQLIKEYVKERDEYMDYLELVEKKKIDQNKRKSIETAKFNILSKEEKLNKRQSDINEQERQSQNEINNMMESKFLNESWSSTLRDDNKNRFIPYNFKGFSQSQKQDILNQQMSQIEDNENRNKYLRDKECEYYDEQKEYQRKTLIQLRNAERLKKQKNRDLYNVHENQIRETKTKIDEINQIYANKVTPDYFNQFQTSTR